jgi:hypothetical protein
MHNNNIQTIRNKANINNIINMNKIAKNNINKVVEKNNNKNNNLEIIGNKYQFHVIDKKIDEKKVNNICFDGDFLDNLKDKNNKKQMLNHNKNLTKNNFKNKKNNKI